MYRLRGKFRRRLLVRAEKNIDIQDAIERWLKEFKIPTSVRVQVDIDPQSFFWISGRLSAIVTRN